MKIMRSLFAAPEYTRAEEVKCVGGSVEFTVDGLD